MNAEFHNLILSLDVACKAHKSLDNCERYRLSTLESAAFPDQQHLAERDQHSLRCPPRAARSLRPPCDRRTRREQRSAREGSPSTKSTSAAYIASSSHRQ